jgi:hypothetical protein
MNNKNKDLPASPVQFQDKFGQLVILAGMTKQEVVALEIFKLSIDGFDILEDCIAYSYEKAELFCSYLEQEPTSIIT